MRPLDLPPGAGRAPHDPTAPAVALVDLGVDYDGRAALDGVTVTITRGGRLAIIGPNGAGKSTLLRAVAGLLRPTRGSVEVFGAEPGRHVCIGYIEQRPSSNWQFPVTVEDVVAMGRVARHRPAHRSNAVERAFVQDALQRFGLASLRHRRIDELSGGQQQRVLIARAIAQESNVLLLDEPLGGLDTDGQEQLLNLINEIGDDIAIIASTHDQRLARRLGHVLVLNKRPLAHGDATTTLTDGVLAAAFTGTPDGGSQDRRVDGGGLQIS